MCPTGRSQQENKDYSNTAETTVPHLTQLSGQEQERLDYMHSNNIRWHMHNKKSNTHPVAVMNARTHTSTEGWKARKESSETHTVLVHTLHIRMHITYYYSNTMHSTTIRNIL